MKIKPLDDKILIDWYDFDNNKDYGGIIVPEKYLRDARENRGTILAIGNDVKDYKIGDKVMYTVGGIYEPMIINGRKVILIPENDILLKFI